MSPTSILLSTHDQMSNNTIAIHHSQVNRDKDKPPVSLACVKCRSRHLKCDAGLPGCGRCRADGSQCIYVRSRRGYRGVRKQHVHDNPSTENALANRAPEAFAPQTTISISSPLPVQPVLAPLMATTSSPFPPFQAGVLSEPLSVPSLAQVSGINAIAQPEPFNFLAPPTSILVPRLPSRNDAIIPTPNYLLDLYYLHFHQAHPILLPRRFLENSSIISYPPFLDQLMEYIGSHYTSACNHEAFKLAAFNVMSAQLPPTGFKVQALLLLAITLHADSQRDQACQALTAAIDMALKLGMHHRRFSEDNSQGSQHLAESWRRTWWELFIVDGMFAAIHQKPSFKMYKYAMETDVPLPCEENVYANSEIIMEPQTLVQLRGRAFNPSMPEFSSYAYRIDAMYLLAAVMRLGQDIFSSNDEEVRLADEGLANWFLQLPPSKKEVIDDAGGIDEILFQGHMIMHAAAIYLHRPRSGLAMSPIRNGIYCARQRYALVPCMEQYTHMTKAVWAANSLSNLGSFQKPVWKHTPFFTCAMALNAIVQLSVYAFKTSPAERDAVRQRTTLAIGVLKSLGEVWSIAHCVMQQVQGVAKEVLVARANRYNPLTEHDQGGFPSGVIEEDLWLSDIAEGSSESNLSLNLNDTQNI